MPRKEIKNCNMVKEKTLPKALFTFTLTDDLIRRFLLAVFVRLLNKFKACANLEHFSEVLVYLWKLRPVNPCHFVVLFYVCTCTDNQSYDYRAICKKSIKLQQS